MQSPSVENRTPSSLAPVEKSKKREQKKAQTLLDEIDEIFDF
jgi:hypothetical protein